MTIETRVCFRCRKEYVPGSFNQKYCDECCIVHRKELDRLRDKLRRKKANILKSKSMPSKSINEIVSEINDYNRKHGTHLTYGKYVEKMTLGLLKD